MNFRLVLFVMCVKLNLHAVFVFVFFLQKVAGIIIGKTEVKSFPDRKSKYLFILVPLSCY